jgi:hypothetical protein
VAGSLPESSAHTVGIDVSDRFSSFCTLDEQGEILEEGKVRTSPGAFTRHFSTLPSRVVLEVEPTLAGRVNSCRNSAMK